MVTMSLVFCGYGSLSPTKGLHRMLPTKMSWVSQKSCTPSPLACYTQILAMTENEALSV